MPYKFTFKVNHETIFEGILESHVCTATCNNGKKCKRHVVIGQDLCYTHLRYQRFLVIKKSTIPGAGNGLFACNLRAVDGVVFKKGQKIGSHYIGQVLSREELLERYHGVLGGSYVMCYQLLALAGYYSCRA